MKGGGGHWEEREEKEPLVPAFLRAAPGEIPSVARAPASGVALKVDKAADESARRKQIPMASGCLDYFPDALMAVAELSRIGNDKHNPGQPLHDARSKSSDDADCILRHLKDRGKMDASYPNEKVRHSTAVAWRALRMLQRELEDAGEAELPRGARK